MSIYKKLNAARVEFHSLPLKKTGHNKFAGYHYFELGDFLVPALNVFEKHGLCAIVSFEAEIATLTINDVEQLDQCIVISSPMGSAQLKGCHEVQNIGAVETYQRRYLWVAALEIVEHDALDATTGSEPAGSDKTGAKPIKKGNERQSTAASRVAEAIIQAIRDDRPLTVVENYQTACDDSDEMADQVWGRLNQQERDYVTSALNNAAKG